MHYLLKQSSRVLEDCSVHPSYTLRPVTDPLYVHVLLIESPRPWCLITLDLTELNTYRTTAIRQAVAAILHSDYQNVWITFTHNHSSWLGKNALNADRLEQCVVQAVRQTLAAAAEPLDGVALISVDTADRFAVNRRAFIEGLGSFSIYQCQDCITAPDGIDAAQAVKNLFLATGTAPGYLQSLKNVYLNGAVDGVLQLLLFGFRHKPVAGLVRFNAHPVILSSGFYKPHFSRDYCGLLQDELETLWHCPILFLQGPAGNQRPRHRENSLEECRLMAHRLARELHPQKVPCPFEPLFRFEAATEFLRCELPDYVCWPPDKRTRGIEQLEEQIHALQPDSNYLREKKRLDDRLTALKSVDTNCQEYGYVSSEDLDAGFKTMELSRLTAGPFSWIAVNHEVANFLSLSLYKEFGSTQTMITAYTNGCDGYLLDDDDYPNGGYETTASVIAPPCSSRLLDAIRHMLIAK